MKHASGLGQPGPIAIVLSKGCVVTYNGSGANMTGKSIISGRDKILLDSCKMANNRPPIQQDGDDEVIILD
jgi:hypothetical protein